MRDDIVTLNNLVHSFDGKKVLDIPGLSIKEGEVLTILGPTGSGKSTLLRVINLLEVPRRGHVFFRGEEINARSRFSVRRRMAMVFQAPLLLSDTVYKNVAYGLGLRGFSKAEIDEEVKRMLKLFSIEHLAEKPAAKLSGGEAQRVSFARALAVRPEILLLDEPFASLDPVIKEQLIGDILSILKSLNTTAVHVTHDRQEAFMLADRIGILDGGKIVQIGAPEEVFYRPVSAQVASFVGTETLLSGLVIAQNEGLATIDVDGKEVEAVSPFKVGEKVTVCIRPEEVVIFKGQGAETGKSRLSKQNMDRRDFLVPRESARNHFPGKVRKIEPRGAVAKVSLDCGFPLVATITRRSVSDLSLKGGEDVVASFKATAVHVIKP